MANIIERNILKIGGAALLFGSVLSIGSYVEIKTVAAQAYGSAETAYQSGDTYYGNALIAYAGAVSTRADSEAPLMVLLSAGTAALYLSGRRKLNK